MSTFMMSNHICNIARPQIFNLALCPLIKMDRAVLRGPFYSGVQKMLCLFRDLSRMPDIPRILFDRTVRRKTSRTARIH